MKRKWIAVGIVSPIVLIAICMAVFLLIGLAAWLFSSGDQQARIIRIIPLAPLTLPEATSPPVTSQNSDQPTEAPVVETEPQQAFEPPSQPTEIPNEPVSLTPPEIEQALGFALPPGSVNSITQEGVATRLVIPKLNLDSPVVVAPIANQTWQVDHLGQNVGHLEGTAAPGSNSNVVLAGHVTLATGVYGPFAGLAQLTPGDVIYVYSGEQAYEYAVDGYQTVEKTAVEVTYPSETGQVTLITCTNWNSIEGHYQQRLVVKGHLVGG